MCVFCALLLRSLLITKRGRGADSEQQLGSLLADFAKVWHRYEVRDQTSPYYARNQRDAVLTINAHHVPVNVVSSGRGAPKLEQTDSRGSHEGPTEVEGRSVY